VLETLETPLHGTVTLIPAYLSRMRLWIYLLLKYITCWCGRYINK